MTRAPPQELELVEDVWRGEAQDLLSQIAQLQAENKQLMTNLSHKDAGFSEEEFQRHEGRRAAGRWRGVGRWCLFARETPEHKDSRFSTCARGRRGPGVPGRRCGLGS